MHTNQTYNFLTIDSPNKLPFPKDVLPYLTSFDWSSFVWNTVGLPSFNSTFNLVGDQLYFEKDASDNVKIRKEDFTGQVLMNGALVPVDSENVFFFVFELSFCNGVLCGATLEQDKNQPKAEYEVGFKKFCANIDREVRIRKSWWFKWLYRPYFHTLKWITLGIIFIVEGILKLFVFLVELCLPIKI